MLLAFGTRAGLPSGFPVLICPSAWWLFRTEVPCGPEECVLSRTAGPLSGRRSERVVSSFRFYVWFELRTGCVLSALQVDAVFGTLETLLLGTDGPSPGGLYTGRRARLPRAPGSTFLRLHPDTPVRLPAGARGVGGQGPERVLGPCSAAAPRSQLLLRAPQPSLGRVAVQSHEESCKMWGLLQPATVSAEVCGEEQPHVPCPRRRLVRVRASRLGIS